MKDSKEEFLILTSVHGWPQYCMTNAKYIQSMFHFPVIHAWAYLNML